MKATVTLKVTPNELQIIDEALRMISQAAKNVAHGAPMLKGFAVRWAVADGKPLTLVRQAEEIRRAIGLS